jgi:hypothetical protein
VNRLLLTYSAIPPIWNVSTCYMLIPTQWTKFRRPFQHLEHQSFCSRLPQRKTTGQPFNAILMTAPGPDWTWAVWIARHLVASFNATAPTVWSANDGVELVFKCSSDRGFLLLAPLDINLQKKRLITTMLTPCSAQRKTRIFTEDTHR